MLGGVSFSEVRKKGNAFLGDKYAKSVGRGNAKEGFCPHQIGNPNVPQNCKA